MEIRGVDPRDIEREMKAVYRVYFWSAGRTVSDEFELTDAADVYPSAARLPVSVAPPLPQEMPDRVVDTPTWRIAS
jgi:hypothetical protein